LLTVKIKNPSLFKAGVSFLIIFNGLHQNQTVKLRAGVSISSASFIKKVLKSSAKPSIDLSIKELDNPHKFLNKKKRSS